MTIPQILRQLDLYKTYSPQSKEDWKEIIDAATKLLKAAGVK